MYRHIPNGITVSRCIAAFVVFSLYHYEWYVTAFITYGVACISDALDGPLARHWNCVSWLGEFLDPAADKLLFWVPFCIMLTYTDAAPWPILVAVGPLFALYDIGQVVRRLADPGMKTTRAAKLKTVVLLSSNGILFGAYLLWPQPTEYTFLIALGTAGIIVSVVMTGLSVRRYFADYRARMAAKTSAT
jgi:CDP-diacylglycerol---glycerol-3-phosphate 3-phosphatidyltransferase